VNRLHDIVNFKEEEIPDPSELVRPLGPTSRTWSLAADWSLSDHFIYGRGLSVLRY
jgi:hypothetical protein